MGSQPDTGQAAFDAEFAALRDHYVGGLAARRAALAEAWSGCVDDASEDAWRQLREVVHKLAGSAPCYGFDALGAAAHGLDRLLSGRAGCRERARAQPQVAQLLAELDAGIAA